MLCSAVNLLVEAMTCEQVRIMQEESGVAIGNDLPFVQNDDARTEFFHQAQIMAADQHRLREGSEKVDQMPSRLRIQTGRGFIQRQALFHTLSDGRWSQPHIDRATGHIIKDGGRKELVIGILKDQPDQSAHTADVVLVYLKRLDADAPLPLEQAIEMQRQRGFFRAIWPDQSNVLARRNARMVKGVKSPI